MKPNSWWGRSCVLALSTALLFVSEPAQACGGTFCDAPGQGQAPMPVDQTGENVLFVMADGWVEAHIQIQYTGDPERFAWVIPVPKTPELSVGSQPMFLNLLNATVPSFTLNTRFDFCGGGDDSSSSAGCGMSSDDSGSASFAPNRGGGGAKNDAPTVKLRQSVGAFEAVVLKPTTAQGMVDWLEVNGFDADAADAVPIIADYVNRDYEFVAIKLRPAAGADEIHPLVLRYQGDEPCVPLKLTGIAAADDMAVRVFFLGERRVVPTNFKHVVMNPAQLDFRGLGSNYNLAVSRAVDSAVANGHAFVTEYAGPSQVTPRAGLYNPAWSSADFSTTTASGVTTKLTTLGLLACNSATDCTAPHPLVFALLDRHLPPPAGVEAAEFYACVSCFESSTEPLAWDPDGFQTDFRLMIAEPGKRANAVLAAYPYLTRMLTRISPSEMSVDPMFKEWAEPLPDEPNSRTATQVQDCDGNWYTQLADGRAVYGGSMGTSPVLPTDMPWAERIEEYTDAGAIIVLVDNAPLIDQVLGRMRPPASVDVDTESSSAAGCGCSLPGRGSGHGIAASLMLGALLLRRSKRRQRRAVR